MAANWKTLWAKRKKFWKIFRNPWQRARFRYHRQSQKPLLKNTALLESYAGSSISGNVYYLLLELFQKPEYAHLSLFVASSRQAQAHVCAELRYAGLQQIPVVPIHSRRYCRLLARAEYLVNNATFPTYLIKRKGQIYLNTWHGTPLKTLGRDIRNAPNELGNTQRNFLMADYLLYPNRFTFEIMRRAYMLDSLYHGQYVLSGYPRNAVFFQPELRRRIRMACGFEGKQIYAYLPTWRGTLRRRDPAAADRIANLLAQLDRTLPENTLVFTKLHNLDRGSVPFAQFQRVKPFPEDYETYAFLAATDCLITDYSSVLFDFAVTGRPILLYCEDAAEYAAARGMYLHLEDFPFPRAETPEALCALIQQCPAPAYREAMRPYTERQDADAAARLCRLVFGDGVAEGMERIDGDAYGSGKEQVLLFAGSLQKNGITAALQSLLSLIDREKREVILLFHARGVEKNKSAIMQFSAWNYMVIQGAKVLSYWDLFCRVVYFYGNREPWWVQKSFERVYRREIDRLFPGCTFSAEIHYSGYEREIMQLFSRMKGKKLIYLHSNLAAEAKQKGNLHLPSVETAYRCFDRLVAIREGMQKELLYPQAAKKLALAHNPIDAAEIRRRALLPLRFDPDTESTLSQEALQAQLKRPGIHRFISIARFSPEKRLDRLIEAFERVCRTTPDCFLILIGGYGPAYGEICKQAEQSACAAKIAILRSLGNVFPILAACDTFVLSSDYEGLPVTILEALVLKKTVLATEIEGPRAFLSQGYGVLTPKTVSGLAAAMKDAADGKLPDMRMFDPEAFNRQALQEWEALFAES